MAASLMAALAPLMIGGATRGIQGIRHNRQQNGNIRERRAAKREAKRPQATPEQLEAARHSPYRQNEYDLQANGVAPQNQGQMSYNDYEQVPYQEEEIAYEPQAYGFEDGYPENPYDMPPAYNEFEGGEDAYGYDEGGFVDDGMAHTMFHPESMSMAEGGYQDGGLLPYAAGGYAAGGYSHGGLPHYGVGGFLKDASSGIFNSIKGMGQRMAPGLIEKGKTMGQGLLNKGADWAGNKVGNMVGNTFGQQYGDMARQGLSQGINKYGNQGLEAAGNAADRFAQQGFQRQPQGGMGGGMGGGMQHPQMQQRPQMQPQMQQRPQFQPQQGGYGQQQPMVRPGNQYASIYG
jgi:hypothetical protein